MKWRSETRRLIAEKVSAGEAFAPAHLASALRAKPETAAFDLDSLGEYVRDLFYEGAISPFVQVPRAKDIVYAATEEDGRALSLAVYVSSRTTKSRNPFIKTKTAAAPVKSKPEEYFAAVHLDRRLHIQRSAVDAFYKASETAPESFTASKQPDGVLLSPAPDGALEVSGGSIYVPSKSEPGNRYSINVLPSGIHIGKDPL